jgi:hypothetical protein
MGKLIFHYLPNLYVDESEAGSASQNDGTLIVLYARQVAIIGRTFKAHMIGRLFEANLLPIGRTEAEDNLVMSHHDSWHMRRYSVHIKRCTYFHVAGRCDMVWISGVCTIADVVRGRDTGGSTVHQRRYLSTGRVRGQDFVKFWLDWLISWLRRPWRG